MKKSGLMYLLIISVWLGLILYYNPRVFISLQQLGVITKIFLVLCMDVFWFQGIYHLFVWIFSRKKKVKPYLSQLVDSPSNLAILYLTKDDFISEAVQSCIRQDYPRFHVFILDDSVMPESREKIDKFAENYRDKLTIIRRPFLKDYKAGNLNYALSGIKDDYPYFAVCDADCFLPSDFLAKLMAYLPMDPKVAFVQAKTICSTSGDTEFARDFSFTQDVHWDYYVPVRADYGFTMFYGRCAIVRTRCWEEIGGFPSSLTEDLVFSTRLRESGYKGIFTPEVVCYERYPQDYIRDRRRYNRWVRGTSDYLVRGFLRFILNRNIAWYEKIDVLTNAITLNLAVPFIGYIVLIWQIYRKWNFFIIILGLPLLQLIPILGVLKKDPLAIFRRVCLFIGISFGSIVNNTVQFIMGLSGIKSPFLVTGISKIKVSTTEACLFIAEIVVGSILCLLSIIKDNIWISSIGTAMLFSPILAKAGWNNRFVRIICCLPLLFSVIAITLLIFHLRVDL